VQRREPQTLPSPFHVECSADSTATRSTRIHRDSPTPLMFSPRAVVFRLRTRTARTRHADGNHLRFEPPTRRATEAPSPSPLPPAMDSARISLRVVK
jgi:hypothetical protein